MKKLLLNTLSVVALVAMASCSSEEPLVGGGTGEPVNVTFSVSADEVLSRTIGDGSRVDRLQWAIFDKNGTFIASDELNSAFASSLIQHVELTLLDGQQYTIGFLANNSSWPSFILDDEGYMVYDESYSSDEDGDCFYNTITFTASSSAGTHIVNLYRPFAQVNLYIDDFDPSDKVYAAPPFVVEKGFYTKMNMYNGELSELSTSDIIIQPLSKLPHQTEGLTNPITREMDGVTYTYLGYFYILAPSDGSLVDFKMLNYYNIGGSWNTLGNVSFYNIPIKRNCRTNIFTTTTESPNFRVTVDNEMYDDHVVYPTLDPVEEAYLIHNLQELAGFDDMVTKGNDFAGKTVKLAADIDLAGVAWTPIGGIDSSERTPKPFNGIFDGDGHTIYNLTTPIDYPSPYNYAFFAVVQYDPSGTHQCIIKNVTFENAKICSFDQDEQFNGNMYAVVAGTSYGNMIFDNVHVNNSSVKGYGKVGGILAMSGDRGGTTTFNNCSVTNTTIYGVYNCGGFAGLMQNKCEITGTASIEGTTWVRDPFYDRRGELQDLNYTDAVPNKGTIKRDINGTYYMTKYDSKKDLAYCAWGNYYTYYVYATNNSRNWYLYDTDATGHEYYVESLPQNTIPQEGDWYIDPVAP